MQRNRIYCTCSKSQGTKVSIAPATVLGIFTDDNAVNYATENASLEFTDKKSNIVSKSLFPINMGLTRLLIGLLTLNIAIHGLNLLGDFEVVFSPH
jgi:hypothetical protein